MPSWDNNSGLSDSIGWRVGIQDIGASYAGLCYTPAASQSHFNITALFWKGLGPRDIATGGPYSIALLRVTSELWGMLMGQYMLSYARVLRSPANIIINAI